MELVALLSTGKGTWAQVAGLLNYGDWDNIILIGNEFAKKFSTNKNHEFVEIFQMQSVQQEYTCLFLKSRLRIYFPIQI